MRLLAKLVRMCVRVRMCRCVCVYGELGMDQDAGRSPKWRGQKSNRVETELVSGLFQLRGWKVSLPRPAVRCPAERTNLQLKPIGFLLMSVCMCVRVHACVRRWEARIVNMALSQMKASFFLKVRFALEFG